MSFISKEWQVIAGSHFIIEMEHVAADVKSKILGIKVVQDVEAEIATLKADAEAKLAELQKLPEFAAYHAAKMAYDQAKAATTPPAV